ncbi:hypothetical protein FPOAC1_012069 [Fusarium poae]|uniref:hypothetical protein n=1 Tax=Fusarium poae TaxID=36050 RepID=UPI001CE8E10E|nr:hypothetical protein FPOAC1_012069 [Fusarium poae]KAG8667243.1 hypothetical protein FPOAC1_012069 [Fusarium poae]
MSKEPHWSSIRHRKASTDRPPPSTRSWNASYARHEFSRRLTLGDLGEWLRERQEPAPGVTLGDVGDWFKRKLPSQRPERGGTLRTQEDRDKGKTSGMRLVAPAHNNGSDSSTGWPLSEQPSDSNRRTGQQSGTGGSDRLVDWNTPKNLSDLSPEQSLLSKGKTTTGQKPPAHRRWNNLGSPRVRNKLKQKSVSDDIASKKDTWEQMQSNAHGAQAFGPAMQVMPGILEVLEARKKAKKRARDDRESLIESGDYLGVQGINPQTGVLDLTSESGDSALSVRTEQKLANLETQAKHATSAVKRKQAEAEIVKMHFDRDITKLRRREKIEKQLAKWRKDTHQWSSVQEPDLSPIAQSHRSISVLSSQYISPLTSSYLLILFVTGRRSRRDHSVPKHEDLIDLSLPDDQPNQEQRPAITPLTSLRSRENAHSSDTVVKTPRCHSLEVPTPAALELFENDIKFQSADELGLNEDLPLEHDSTPPKIHAQAMSSQSSEMTDAREVKEAYAGTNKATLEPFLDKTPNEQTEPGQAAMSWATTCPQTLPDLSTINLPVVSRDTTFTLVKNAHETPSSWDSNPQKGSMQGSTTSHKRFTIQPKKPKQNLSESLENQCQQADLSQTLTGRA